MLINIADEFGFKIKTFQHVLEGYKVAKEIAAHGAGASIFADSWGYKIEAYDAIPYNAAIMTRAGVVVSMNSDSDERARRLNIEAAKAMHWGDLTEEQALKLVTLNPAIQLGIQDRVGSIEVGKDADVVIWNGHPFSVYSRVDTTFIDGDVSSTGSRTSRDALSLPKSARHSSKLSQTNHRHAGSRRKRPAVVQADMRMTMSRWTSLNEDSV